jgi:hypothetical protein
MSSLVSRQDVREENRRTLKVIIGVIIFLVVVSVLIIMARHGGIHLS